VDDYWKMEIRIIEISDMFRKQLNNIKNYANIFCSIWNQNCKFLSSRDIIFRGTGGIHSAFDMYFTVIHSTADTYPLLNWVLDLWDPPEVLVVK
jgi:hypothetical protein